MLQPVHNFLGSSIRPKLPGLAILNVTQMTAQRKDGHLSVYLRPSGPVPLHRQDCSHWCLPGVPDTWNELLYAVFMKRQTVMDQNVSLAGSTTLNTGWLKSWGRLPDARPVKAWYLGFVSLLRQWCCQCASHLGSLMVKCIFVRRWELACRKLHHSALLYWEVSEYKSKIEESHTYIWMW